MLSDASPPTRVAGSCLRVRHGCTHSIQCAGKGSPVNAFGQRTRWALAGTASGLVIAFGPVAGGAAMTPNPGVVTIRVGLGETLSAIAARYNSTVAGLAAVNRTSNPNLVVAGEVLSVPGTGAATTLNPGVVTIRVGLGETLSAIAARYNSTVAGLAAVNRISNPNLVVAGAVLSVPGTGAATT